MYKSTLSVLLADDDIDDRFYFKEALEALKMQTKVEFVNDGVELMNHLTSPDIVLPDILFLDLKTRLECLSEIRKNENLKNLIIVIYSTSASEEDIEDAFVKGANVYIKKPDDFNSLKKIITSVMTLNWQYHTMGMNRDNFFLSFK